MEMPPNETTITLIDITGQPEGRLQGELAAERLEPRLRAGPVTLDLQGGVDRLEMTPGILLNQRLGPRPPDPFHVELPLWAVLKEGEDQGEDGMMHHCGAFLDGLVEYLGRRELLEQVTFRNCTARNRFHIAVTAGSRCWYVHFDLDGEQQPGELGETQGG